MDADNLGKDNMWVVNILMSEGQEMVMRKMVRDRRTRDEYMT